jgi:hypothetical protein
MVVHVVFVLDRSGFCAAWYQPIFECMLVGIAVTTFAETFHNVLLVSSVA